MALDRTKGNYTDAGAATVKRATLKSGIYIATIKDAKLKFGFDKEKKVVTDSITPMYVLEVKDEIGKSFEFRMGYFGSKPKLYPVTNPDGTERMSDKMEKDNRALAEAPLGAIGFALLAGSHYVPDEEGNPIIENDGSVRMVKLDVMTGDLITWEEGRGEKWTVTGEQLKGYEGKEFKVFIKETVTVDTDGSKSGEFNELSGIFDIYGRNRDGIDQTQDVEELISKQENGIFTKKKYQGGKGKSNSATNAGSTNTASSEAAKAADDF